MQHPDLVRQNRKEGKARTPLHIATTGQHFPNGPAVIAAIDAGAGPNAHGGMQRTPPWVASSDVEAFEVLIKAGADIEALGGSIGGGTPLDNAVGYGQWQVARRLVACGARTKLWHAAALGLMPRVEANFAGDALPTPEEITTAFYQACGGGQREPAEYLLCRGADINWIPDRGQERHIGRRPRSRQRDQLATTCRRFGRMADQPRREISRRTHCVMGRTGRLCSRPLRLRVPRQLRPEVSR